jgi:hypothetical protein
MAIRDILNKNPAIMGVAGVTILLAGLIALAMQIWGGSPRGQEFYTDDDGKTFFADSAGRIVPYQHNGKEVVIAEVFKTEKHAPYVAYMRRYTAAALQQIAQAHPDQKPGELQPIAPPGALPPRMEYKKPGDPQWHDIDGNYKAMAAYLPLNSDDGTPMEQVSP